MVEGADCIANIMRSIFVEIEHLYRIMPQVLIQAKTISLFDRVFFEFLDMSSETAQLVRLILFQ